MKGKTGLALARWWLPLFVAMSAVGCGGGGDSGGSQPVYSVQVTPGAIRFDAERNASLPSAQTASAAFRGDGLIVGYPPGVIVPSWLSITATGQASPVSIQFAVTSTALNAGTYATTVRFVSGKADGSAVVTYDVPVTYVVTDPLRVSPSSMFFDATSGAGAVSRQVQITGANIRWTATSAQPWLTVSRSSGFGVTTVTVSANAAALASGVHSTELSVTDLNTNLTRTVPVEFHVSANRWNASRTGVSLVAFSDQPTPPPSRVIVTNDAQANLNWTATANVPWLTVTPTGANGAELSVEINAAVSSLAFNTVHIGTITISGDGIASETVRAGFYRASTLMPTVTHFTGVSSTSSDAMLVIDPIRPVAYVAIRGTPATRVDLITGQSTSMPFLIPTNLPVGTVEVLAVSGDGRYLYGTSYGAGMARWDLDSGATVGTLLPITTFCCGQDLILLRQRGVEVLVDSHFKVFNLSTGMFTALTDASSTDNFWYVGGSKDGRDFFRYYLTGLDRCPSAQRFSLVTRPSTGDGYMTDLREPPRNAGSFDCVTIRGFDTSRDSSRWYLLNYGSLVTGPVGGPMSPLHQGYGFNSMRVGHTDRKVLGYFTIPSSSDRAGLVVLDANDGIIGTFSDAGTIYDVGFFAEDRFALFVGPAEFDLGGLHMYRVP